MKKSWALEIHQHKYPSIALLTPIRKTLFCANNHFQPIHHACQNGKHIKLQLWIGELRGS